jgi:hypothetical protein
VVPKSVYEKLRPMEGSMGHIWWIIVENAASWGAVEIEWCGWEVWKCLWISFEKDFGHSRRYNLPFVGSEMVSYSLKSVTEPCLKPILIKPHTTYTGSFIMFFVITNFCNKKTKEHTLMKLFKGTEKRKKSFFFTTRDVCTTDDSTHQTSLVVNKKNSFSFPVVVKKFHYGRSYGFLVINIRNHGEHNATPRIVSIPTYFNIFLPCTNVYQIISSHKVAE